MSRSEVIKLVLIILILVVLLISVATKGAHWDQVTYKNSTKDAYPEVYPGLEGCLVIDIMLAVAFIAAIVFGLVGDLKKYTKFLLILLVLLLVIRLILALLFLAGDNNYCKKRIQFCDDNGDRVCYYMNGRVISCYATYCDSDYSKTLKGAWVFEIIAFIIIYSVGLVIMFFMFKESK